MGVVISVRLHIIYVQYITYRERKRGGKTRTFPIYFPSRESVKRSTDDSNLETNWREFWCAFSGADVVVVSWHSKWLEGKSGEVIQLDWRVLLVKHIRRHQQSIRCEFHGRPGRWRRGKGSNRLDVMDCQEQPGFVEWVDKLRLTGAAANKNDADGSQLTGRSTRLESNLQNCDTLRLIDELLDKR